MAGTKTNYLRRDDMKTVKKIIGLMMALIVTLSINPTVAKAATEDSIPSKVRLYYSQESSAIKIELADMAQTIGNIKTNDKNLYAMLTSSYLNYESGEESSPSAKNEYTIGVRSKKNGTYTVSFDILDKDKKKVATKEVKVFIYDTPLKSITFNGKELKSNELTGKSAKVKVTLTSGNDIKKLEYGVYASQKDEYGTTSEFVYKTFKNGAAVTFGTKPYYSEADYSMNTEYYSSVSKSLYTNMEIPTYIVITYYDKYTKQNETFTDYYYKYVE